MVVSFIGGGNRRTRGKLPTCRNLLTLHNVVHLALIEIRKTPSPLDWINSDAELYIVKPV
jgi:hypothetical protein